MSPLAVALTQEKPLAVVSGSDDLAKPLAKKLEERGFAVFAFDPQVASLPAILHPDYLFYFLPGLPWSQSFRYLQETCHWVKKSAPKIILLGLELGLPQQEYVDSFFRRQNIFPRRVNLLKSTENEEDAFVDYLFTPESVSGWRQFKTSWNFTSTGELPAKDSSPIVDILISGKKIPLPAIRIPKVFYLVVALAVFLVGYLAWVFAPTALAVKSLLNVKNELKSLSNTEVKIEKLQSSLLSAKDNFSLTRERIHPLSSPAKLIHLDGKLLAMDNLLSLGEAVSSSAYHGLGVAGHMQKFFKGVTDPNSPTYTTSSISLIGPELSKLDQDLGLVQADVDSLNPFWRKWVYSRYGDLISEISGTRQLLRILAQTSPHWGEILGDPEKKTYLIALQNPAELRPSGGFIGSFALATFDKGKLLTLQINDVYTADGQLQAHVAPPDEILHFLGQPNWYLRDANWSADFPLTARRLEWFLDKEMGVATNGVIGLDLHAIENLLRVTGPLDLIDLGEKVTAENFFEKAEFRSEIKFFPGSTQKADFISEVSGVLLDNLQTGKIASPAVLLRALTKSVAAKNVQIYLDDPELQGIMQQNHVAGQLRPDFCLDTSVICLGEVDANLGANKSNYYLERSFNLLGEINKDGSLSFTYKMNLINHSPNNTWPGGSYKNYFRFYLPPGSVVESVNVGDDRTASISATLTAKALADLPKDKFLVKTASEAGLLELGSLVEVPPLGNKTVTLKFRTPAKIDLDMVDSYLKIDIIKQAGTLADKWNFTLDYPTFLTYVPSPLNTFGAIDTGHQLRYNTVLDRDLRLSFKFRLQPQ